MSWFVSYACVLVHTTLFIAWKSVTELTSSCGWSIVRVGNAMTCCFGCWFQYQLVSTCTEQIYCALTTNSLEVIICPSTVLFSCSVCASDMKMIT